MKCFKEQFGVPPKEFLNNAAVVFDDKREENLKEKLAEERKEKAAYTLYWERQNRT